MTRRVIIGEFAFMTFASSSSQGITCSIWYLRRRATLVTAAGSIAEGMRSWVSEGRTSYLISCGGIRY